MFSLVVTIISILLVAGLAAVSVFYGGAVFTSGSSKTLADTLIGQAQQIAGANDVYLADRGAYASNVAALVSNSFLASGPAVPADLRHGTTPDWTLPSSAGGPTDYQVAGSFRATPDAACQWWRDNAYPAATWTIVNNAGNARCSLNNGNYAEVYSMNPSMVIMTYAAYQAFAIPTSNNPYAILLNTAGQSDAACREVNRISLGVATIGGTAGHSGGGMGTSAYGAGESSIKTVMQALTVKFACARFGSDNVVMYKG